MSMISLRVCGLICALAGVVAAQGVVLESAREIPVAATADVIVVGGSSGAVEAASAAAKAGAKVFLVAPQMYLGEDMAGTFQLWLEPGEEPTTQLAKRLYSGPASDLAQGLPFTYKTTVPAGGKHPDSSPPSLLAKHRDVSDAAHDSVQYDGDVTIAADLGAPATLSHIEVAAFVGGDYRAQSVEVSISGDQKEWRSLGTFKIDPEGRLATVKVPGPVTLRYAKVTVKRADGSTRLLLGALRFIPAAPQPGAAPAPAVAVRPMHVKKTLDEALLAAKVDFLFGCYATDLVVDGNGKPCGVVICNRSGRQVILGKVIIDATERAIVARMAGAKIGGSTGGAQSVKWVSIRDNKQYAGEGVRKLPYSTPVFNLTGKATRQAPASWYEHTLSLKLAGDSFASWAALEQAIRDKSYDDSQLYTSDLPLMVPPWWVEGSKRASAWAGAEQLELETLRPAGVERVWVLGGCADLPRAEAAKLMRPVAMMAVGQRLGTAAAEEAKRLPTGEGLLIGGTKAQKPLSGDVRERLEGLRPAAKPRRIPQAARGLPVLGEYDVVVVGGGTAGAPAGIGAARQGAKTLVVEQLHGLGGVGTLGMIGKYWYGNRVGFTKTVPENPVEERMEHLRSELRKAGAEVWFGVMGCGALVEGNRITGVVLATPFGRGVVRARVVIDATGNAEIASAGGAATEFVDENFALQASHVPIREMGSSYINGNRVAVDAADPVDVKQALLNMKAEGFDWGQIIDSRERQRIIGDYRLDWLDQINKRTFPDSILLGTSDYDSHGYQIHPFFALRTSRPPDNYKHAFWSYVPYRCLLPKGIEGILVVGLGMSAHRDAMPIVRMQPDLQNSGYAAGVAAAMARKAEITPRKIDVKALQKHLVEIGNLPASVLKDTDSFPMPKEKLASAVRAVVKDYAELEVLMAQPADALPLLREAYKNATGAEKLALAHVLGVMGDATGLETLIAEAKRLLADKKAMAETVTWKNEPVTRLIWAMGYTRDRRAVPVLAELAEATAAESGTRHRAIAVSLGWTGDPAAAPVLAKMLQTKGRAGELGELVTACALVRCGDKDGLGKSALERIAQGTNGPYARLAWQVLSGK